jgi:hypothetical protein
LEPGFGVTEGSIMRRAIIVAALLLSAADAALADHPVPDPVWLTVDSGADLRLSSPTFWDRGCNPLGVTVTVTQPPAHGTVSVVAGLNTANPNPRFGSPGPCGGTLIMGKRVVYRSEPRFHGNDYVIYHYVSARGNRAEAHVYITVR